MSLKTICFRDDDLSKETDLSRFKLIHDLFEKHKVKHTVHYPAWNKSNSLVDKVATEFGMTVSNKKVSISRYVMSGGKVDEDTVNFHFWADECLQLEQALKIYKNQAA